MARHPIMIIKMNGGSLILGKTLLKKSIKENEKKSSTPKSITNLIYLR
jgi:hypothetical protein